MPIDCGVLARLLLGGAMVGAAVLSGGCDALGPLLNFQPVETELSIVNLSRRWYAVFAVRPVGEAGRASVGKPAGNAGLLSGDGFALPDMIPPGAVVRERFLDLFPTSAGCPLRVDLRIYLYKRVNESVPIGLDPGEAVDPQPVASAEVLDVAACQAAVASTFTIVLRDSDEGRGVLQVAQDTSAARRIEFEGDTAPPLAALPPRLGDEPIEGSVIAPDGSPVPGVGVLLRTRFRVNDNDSDLCPEEPVGVCFSQPIAITATDRGGGFSFARPPGAYQVEVFGDGLLFRPVSTAIETPIDNLVFIAEPGS